jgi:hypothetical protein
VRKWLDAPNFHTLTSVAVGCRIVYNATTDKATGATNSALGVVARVHLAPPHKRPPCAPADAEQPWVDKLTVRLDASGQEVLVTRTRTLTTHHDGRAYTKRTFPTP